jgi:dihydroxyacetone kinase-like predicted kinase
VFIINYKLTSIIVLVLNGKYHYLYIKYFIALAMSYIQLFQLLKAKIGEPEAEALVEFVDAKVKESSKDANDQNLKILTTKEDIAVLKQDITNLRSELKQVIANTNEKIANSKTDMIKWMVGFWLAQMAAIIGLYIKK